MWLFYSYIRFTQEYIQVGLCSDSFVQKEDFSPSSQSFILAVGLIAAIVDVFEHIRKLLDRSLPLNITNNYFELF